jgi:hypothetical protein
MDYKIVPERYTLVLRQSDGTSLDINLRPLFAAYDTGRWG